MMKVLWFSITPSLYHAEGMKHNGGGWIASLERIIREKKEINLGIAFQIQRSNSFKEVMDGVTYYPIVYKENPLQKIYSHYSSKKQDKFLITQCLKIIEDYKPDLIQIFGTENCYGLLKQYTNIPIVIHIQGSWPSYWNAIFPPGYSVFNDLLRYWYNPFHIIVRLMFYHFSRERAKREKFIFKLNNNFMGRTFWDHALTNIFSPNSHYYYCSEALRSVFINSEIKWKPKYRGKVVIITVGSWSTLKGIDVVLKTAKLLKELTNIKFEWRLVGPSNNTVRFYERFTGILSKEVNVEPLGPLSAQEVLNELLDCDFYVHTAYIDNSPNSICEAQYIGVPIIATNVGGIPALFSDQYPKQYLYAANDIYYLASIIKQLTTDSKDLLNMSNLNYHLARERHNGDNIYRSLINIYNKILD